MISEADPLQRRVRKVLPIIEWEAGTASADEKEALRIMVNRPDKLIQIYLQAIKKRKLSECYGANSAGSSFSANLRQSATNFAWTWRNFS